MALFKKKKQKQIVSDEERIVQNAEEAAKVQEHEEEEEATAAIEQQKQEQEVIDPGKRKFLRKRRFVEKEETASTEEVKQIHSKNFFKKGVSDRKEKDYLAKKHTSSMGFMMGQSEDDDDESEVLELSKEIADAFGLVNVRDPETKALFNVKEEPVLYIDADYLSKDYGEEIMLEEPVVEDVIQPVYPREVKDVMKELKKVTDDYFNRTITAEDGYCSVGYAEDGVQEVRKSEKGLELANYRVFVNGKLQRWDNTFEIKVPAGATVEVETGVCLHLSDNVKIEVGATADSEDKYFLEYVGTSTPLTYREAAEQIVATFKAHEGAYLSKIGRVVNCKLVV